MPRFFDKESRTLHEVNDDEVPEDLNRFIPVDEVPIAELPDEASPYKLRRTLNMALHTVPDKMPMFFSTETRRVFSGGCYDLKHKTNSDLIPISIKLD